MFEVCDKIGNLPLHTAIKQRLHSQTLILKIIDSYPKAIEKCNIYGEYPLHLAVIRNQSEQVIVKIMELFPAAIELPNKNGKTPLALVASKLADKNNNNNNNFKQWERILTKMNEMIVSNNDDKHSSKKRKSDQLWKICIFKI